MPAGYQADASMITPSSPRASSAWPMRPSPAGRRMRSTKPKAEQRKSMAAAASAYASMGVIDCEDGSLMEKLLTISLSNVKRASHRRARKNTGRKSRPGFEKKADDDTAHRPPSCRDPLPRRRGD